MAKPFKGVVNVDVTESVPDWGPYTQPIAPAGTPSVLYIVLDDVGYLEQSDQLDNTLVMLVSDNGASGEDGPNGSVNENKMFNGLPDTIEEALPVTDDYPGDAP